MSTTFYNQQPEDLRGKTAYFGGKPPLSEAVGYAVVLGWGAFFSILTTLVVFIERKMSGQVYTSERFK
jgi:hypothetical protein